MLRLSLMLLCTTAVVGTARAADPTIADGSYLLSYSGIPTSENRVAIIKFTTKDGKTVGEFVNGGEGQRKWEVSNIKVNGREVTAKAVIGPNDLTFEGLINPKNPKEVLGSLGDNRLMFRAYLVPTELEAIDAKASTAAVKPHEALAEVAKARSTVTTARFAAQRETDADKRKELLEKAADAQKELDKNLPGMLVKALESMKETDNFGAFTTTLDVIAVADKAEVKADTMKKWVESAKTFADNHGTRFASDANSKLISALASQTSTAPLAIGYAETAIKENAKAPAAVRVKFMKALAMAQEKSGKVELARATNEAVEKIELEVDAEYRKTAIPFKVQKYAGRTSKEANTVAVMELFTGAQCPPCVAADVAFDALHKAYDHKDLILIQYHMHIPGPDPLTNPSSVGRWDYYRGKYGMEIRGTPSTLFNGKPAAAGGGGMANAKKKFDDYSAVIDEILEKKTDVTVKGSARLAANEITVDCKVAGIKEPTDKQSVRLLLLEEEVRYVGGNALRLHHMVVRSDFNLKDGKAIKDLKDGSLTTKLSLTDVRKGLNEYLTDFSKTRPFANPDRPLHLKKLIVVAIVQDDESKEILQAVQLEVNESAS